MTDTGDTRRLPSKPSRNDCGGPPVVMTEDQARAVLASFDGIGGVEHWIAAQSWQAAPDGWIVAGDLGGWRFWLRPVPGGVRVSAAAPGGWRPAVWVVPKP